MLYRLPDRRATPSVDLPCIVCGGTVVRWSTASGAELAVRCNRCETVRFAPSAGFARAASHLMRSYRADRRLVRRHIAANLAVIADLTRGRRLLEVGCAGEVVSAMARKSGFSPTTLRLTRVGGRRTTAGDPAFVAPLEREVLSDRIYDVVYAKGGLGRAPDPRAFITNLSFLLTRRGVLFVNAPAIEPTEDGGISVARLQRNAFTRGGLAELVENAGFTIVCESAATPGTIGYIARLED